MEKGYVSDIRGYGPGFFYRKEKSCYGRRSGCFTNMERELKNIFCPKCGRYLGREALVEGTFEVKCQGCKTQLLISAHAEEIQISPRHIDKIDGK